MGKIILIFLMSFISGRIYLYAQSTDLPEIQIRSRVLKYLDKGDTLEFNSIDYSQKNTFKLSSLLEGMPGFRVDGSGRVFFNGKEIQRVLINGDDISGDQYSVIVKNLRAGLIEKIQLIKKFETNRLINVLQPSEHVAINLVIKKEFLGKLNGSIGVGIAKNNGGFHSEGILLNPVVKTMGFAGGSGKGGMSEFGSYDGRDVSQKVERARTPIRLRNWDEYFLTDIPLPLQSMGEQGNVWGGMHFRTNNQDKINFQYRAKGVWLGLSGNDEWNFPKWGLVQAKNTKEHIYIFENNILFDWKVDRGKSWKIDNKFEFNHKRFTHSLVQHNSGILNFTQDNYSLHTDRELRFENVYTKSISKSSIVLFSHELHTQNKKVNTSIRRYSIKEFDTSSTSKYQTLAFQGLNGKLEFKLIHNWGRIHVDAGIRHDYYGSRFILNRSPQSIFQSKTIANSRWSMKLIKRVQAEIQFALGSISYRLGNEEFAYKLLYGFKHTLVYQPKAVSKWFQEFELKKMGFDLHHFYSGSYLDEMGTKHIGNMAPMLPTQLSWNFGYLRFNLHRGFTYRVLTQFNRSNREQILGLGWSDDYEFVKAVTANMQTTISGHIHADQFIFPFRSKLGIEMGYVHRMYPFSINDQWGVSRWSHVQSGLSFTTSWKKSFNFQLNYRFGISRSWQQDEYTRRTQNIAGGWGVSAKLNPLEKLNLSIQFSSFQNILLDKNLFLLNADLQFKFNKQTDMGFVLLNGLNHKTYTRMDITQAGNSIQVRNLVGRQLFLKFSYSF